MSLRRLRGPLVAAITTLLLAGGSVALATDPSVAPASTGTAAEEPGNTGSDTDNVQDEVQDENGADDAAEAADPAEADAGAADTDNVQDEVQDESGAPN